MINFWRFIGRACVDTQLQKQFPALYAVKEKKIVMRSIWNLCNDLGLRTSLYETWEIARLIDDKRTFEAMQVIGAGLPHDYFPSFTINELYEAIGICSLDIEFAKTMHKAAVSGSTPELRSLLVSYGINLCTADLEAYKQLIAKEDVLKAIQFINENDWDFPCDEARFFTDTYDQLHWYGDPWVSGFLYGDKLREFRKASLEALKRIVEKA